VDGPSSCSPLSGGFSSGQPGTIDGWSHEFNKPGVYHYVCSPHCGSGMRGSITVSSSTDEPDHIIIALPTSFTPGVKRVNLGDVVKWTGLESGFHNIIQSAEYGACEARLCPGYA